MTMRLLVATTNPGKVRELRAILADLGIDAILPGDVGLDLDVVEDGATFEANAVLKALAFADAADMPALADDSGLEVDALGGEPGVHSARWAPGSDEDRVVALLARLDAVPPERRSARFRTVAALAVPGRVIATAAGAVEGRIAAAPVGEGGFGYDPVFLVEDGGLDGTRTMAELDAATKNDLSHRARAVAGLGDAIGRLVATSSTPTVRTGAGASPALAIRPFRPTDEDAVVSLWRRCGLTRPSNDPRKDIARKSKVQAEWFLVGTLDETIVATVMAGYDGHRGWLYYVGVDPTHRGRGIGRAMLVDVERRMRALGCPKINLQVRTGNDDAMAFYRALGYAVDDVIGMGKRLIDDQA
ncbi:MAG: GNAT family acetyltransferase [Ardenticatenales bacterium]